jgi:hypothetical protein
MDGMPNPGRHLLAHRGALARRVDGGRVPGLEGLGGGSPAILRWEESAGG